MKRRDVVWSGRGDEDQGVTGIMGDVRDTCNKKNEEGNGVGEDQKRYVMIAVGVET